jgi:hypothetical protein
MKANYGIIMVIAIFFVVSITFVTAFPSENDDQPTFTLRELMDVLNDKRSDVWCRLDPCGRAVATLLHGNVESKSG